MTKKIKSSTLMTLSRHMDFRLQLFLEGMGVGFITGIVVVFYRFMLDKADSFRNIVYGFLKSNSFVYTLFWLFVLFIIALILDFILKKEPFVSGSGIPQVKGILLSQLKMNWFKVIINKIVGGILAIGAGLSLGREGPSIQLGAAVGQGFSRFLGRLRMEENYLITSGASAGLAAAFNAPLAGVIFSLEEMHKSFSPLVLTSATAASLVADFISKHFFGQKPVFDFHALPNLPLNYYLYLIGLGILLGLFGAFFNRALVKAQDLFKVMPISQKTKLLIPLFIGGLLGFCLPETLGGGHHLINSLDAGKLTLGMLLILVIVKFLFTLLSYASGAPGGIFLPLLVIGALSGNFYGEFLAQYLNIPSHFINNFIVLAMAAYFTAIVKAPITGSILITEMTGSFSHLLSLITVSMVAYLITDLLGSQPIYDVLLKRLLANKKNNFFIGSSDRKSLVETVVQLGSEIEKKRVRDIAWPKSSLLIAIKRGETEIIPKGNTRLYVGDYLLVLTNEDLERETKKALSKLTGI